MNIEMKNSQLSGIIREEREKRNLTQEHLAELAEVNARTIQRLETSGAHSKETLMAVAEAFGVDCKDLLKMAEDRALKQKDNASPYLVIQLVRRRSGKALLSEFVNCDGMRQDYPEKLTQERQEAVGWILDYIRDYMDCWDDVEPSQALRYEQEVSGKLNELETMGLGVYVGAYAGKQTFENGKSLRFRVNVVLIASTSDPRIIKLGECEEFINGLVPRRGGAGM